METAPPKWIANKFELEQTYFEGAYTKESISGTHLFEGTEDDVYLATYPRSGTSWTQNILVGLCYGIDLLRNTGHEEMGNLFPYLELVYGTDPGQPGYAQAQSLIQKPRLFKTHLPCHLAPREIFTKQRKTILVVRNPKDVALSLFKFYQSAGSLSPLGKTKDLDEFLDLFLQGKVLYGSWWLWTKKWIEVASQYQGSIMVVHYEDLHDDFERVARNILEFLERRHVSDSDLLEIKKETMADEMRVRYLRGNPLAAMFVRQGKANGWKESFPPEFVEKFDDVTRQTFTDKSLQTKFM